MDDLSACDNLSLNSLDFDEVTGEPHSRRPSQQDSSDANYQISAELIKTEIVKDATRTYAVYEILVKTKDRVFTVFRRYSDFDDLHKTIGMYIDVSELNFPGKRTFNNLQLQFLEKRRHQLNAYLQVLLSPHILFKHNIVRKKILDFLEDGSYRSDRGQLSRTVSKYRIAKSFGSF